MRTGVSGNVVMQGRPYRALGLISGDFLNSTRMQKKYKGMLSRASATSLDSVIIHTILETCNEEIQINPSIFV